MAKAADESVAARTNSYNPAFDRQAGVTATGAGVWKGLHEDRAFVLGILQTLPKKMLLACRPSFKNLAACARA